MKPVDTTNHKDNSLKSKQMSTQEVINAIMGMTWDEADRVIVENNCYARVIQDDDEVHVFTPENNPLLIYIAMRDGKVSEARIATV